MTTEKKADFALKLVKEVIRNQEIKFRYIGDNTLAVTNVGTFFHFSGIAQGDTESLRDGVKISVIGLGYHGRVINNLVGVISIVRIILFVDQRQVARTFPTTAGLLHQVHPLAYISNQNARYRILSDITVNTDEVSNQTTLVKTWKRVNINVKYDGPTAVDITRNGIYLFVISDAVANEPSFQHTGFIRYTDG